MLRLSLALVILSAQPAALPASAESNGGPVGPDINVAAPGQPINRGHITSTGETVPRPGLSQSGGETPLDRSIKRQNDQIDNSICKGC